MKYIELIPFILLAIGTLGLLIVEFIGECRCLTLTFAVLNALGLIMLFFAKKKPKK